MPNVDMQRYWLPDFERRLIGELQRQQNGAQFCDTLLQTEGVSIPTHSSVLAAFSLHLSQRLSACPPPPTGQKRKLQLHTLKPQTLIKLVGLLYSGELEVNSALEKQDILAAAQLFGLPDLVEGQTNVGEIDPCKEKGSGKVEMRKKDAQVQSQIITEVIYGRRCVSTGTQTLTEDTEWTISKSQHQQNVHSSSRPHSCNVSAKFQAENGISDTLSSTTCPTIPSILGAYSDGESTLDQFSDNLTNATSSHGLSSCETMALHPSPSEDSESRLQGGDIQQNLPESSSGSDKNSSVLEEDGTRKENMSENTSQANRGGTVGVEKRHISTIVSSKSLEKMHQVMEATQISIKVKLRRRRTTKEEMWEVVNMQDADQTHSVVNSLRQDGSHCKRSQDDHTAVQSSPTTTHVCHIYNSVTSVLQPTASSPKTHPHPSITSNSCPSDTLNQNTGVVSAPGQTEETDEQIEKLLEDIMIGLNIFPSVDKDNNKSHNGGPAACRVQKDTVSYCVYYQDCGTQSDHSSTDTAQNRPVEGSSSLPPAEPSGADVLSPKKHNSSLRGRDGSSYCKSSRSAESSFCGEQQELHFPAGHKSTSQEDPNDLEFLPLSNENEAQLFSIADLQFPPCLSPLDSVYDTSTSSRKKTPGQSALPGRAWLMENPGSLEFPLSAVTHKVNSLVVSKHCSTEDSCKDTTDATELHTDGIQRRETESPSNSQHLKNPGKVNRNVKKCNAYDIMTNDVAPTDRNSKCTNVEMNDTCREVRVRANVKINLSPCSVSLSSNNVLAKERKKVTSTAGKLPSQHSILTRSLRARAKTTGENLRNTLNKTREELRNVQKIQSHTTLENLLLCPVASGTEIQIKRKRGRPRKTPSINLTSPGNATPVVEKNGHNEEHVQHLENPNLEETGEAKQTRRKRKRERRDDVEERPLKQMVSIDPKPDDNNNSNPAEKRPHRVSLKEFQELIKRQHLKTRRLKEKCVKELGEAVEREGGDPRTETIQITENSHSEDIDVTDVSDGQAEISSRQFVNQSGNARSTSPVDDESSPVSDKNNSAVNEHQSVFSFGVLQEEVAEHSLETSHDDSTNKSEVNIDDDDDSSPLASNIFRKSDASDLQEAGSKDGSMQQDDDEEEVDVLLHSPDRSPVNAEYNKAVEISPNEEEEEDNNDVDVTGDETDVCIDV